MGKLFKHRDKYVIPTNGKLVPVTRKVYIAYYQQKRKEKTAIEYDEKYGSTLYEGIPRDEKGYSSEELLSDRTTLSLEEKIEFQEEIQKLYMVINLLSSEEQYLIQQLFFYDKTERQLGKEIGTPQTTINAQKRIIIRKLKKLLRRDL